MYLNAFQYRLEVLIQLIYQQYLNQSYCITVVSETDFNPSFQSTFISLVPSEDYPTLLNQILTVSEISCSDYIIHMRDPNTFLTAFDKALHIGNNRRSDRHLVILPYTDTEADNAILLKSLSHPATSYIAHYLLILPSNDTIEDDIPCKTYDLVTHRFEGPDEEAHFPVYLDKWDSCTGYYEKNVNLFPHDMSNMQGKRMGTAIIHYPPYVVLDLDRKRYPTGRDGIEMRIADEYCRWTNCTVVLVKDDFLWGEIYDNGTAKGIFGNVYIDKADMGFAALYEWYEQYLYLDYSVAVTNVKVTCLVPAARLLSSWMLPLLPFTWEMWLALLITFFYACLALTIAQGCKSDNVFFTTFGMMVTQSADDAGGTWRIRSVTGWLLVTGLVLDNAYGGGLASSFTVPNYEKSIDTVQDIIDRKMEWTATHPAWSFALVLSPDPTTKQLLKLFRVYTSEVLLKKTFKRTTAFVIEKLPGGHFALDDYLTREATPGLQLMVEDLYRPQCTIMLRKSSPYTEKLNQLIGRLHAAGLLLAWETMVSLEHLDNQITLQIQLSRSKKEVELAALSMKDVVGIFIILFGGIFTSMLGFAAEHIYYRTQQRKLVKIQLLI